MTNVFTLNPVTHQKVHKNDRHGKYEEAHEDERGFSVRYKMRMSHWIP